MHRPGFTMLELMIALAIVALLAAFAVPSYRQQVAHGHRAAAVAALYRAAHHMESIDDAPAITLPDALSHAPADGRPAYRLEVRRSNSDDFAYKLEARPLDTGPMHDDRCGTFTLDASGVKSNVRPDGTDAWDPACWGVR